MKRLLLSILVVGILLLVACGAPTTAPSSEAPLTPSPTEQPAPVSPETPSPAPEPISPPTPSPAPTPAPAPTPSAALPQLDIHFIDVEQGDSILIDCGEYEILIDGGGKSPGVVNYLKPLVDGSLEVMVATHPHADHIGGLIDVLVQYQVNEIWHNGDTATSKTYSEFMAAVDSEGASVNIARRGNQILWADIILDVLNPPDKLWSDTNNNSIVLRLSYGDIAFLFTGDAEKEAELSILESISSCQAEILKIGHHGSNTASSPVFIDAVMPEVAIYMAGANNRYGHPHQETIDALTKAGAKIYGTDINGTIIITTNGKKFAIDTEK